MWNRIESIEIEKLQSVKYSNIPQIIKLHIENMNDDNLGEFMDTLENYADRIGKELTHVSDWHCLDASQFYGVQIKFDYVDDTDWDLQLEILDETLENIYITHVVNNVRERVSLSEQYLLARMNDLTAFDSEVRIDIYHDNQILIYKNYGGYIIKFNCTDMEY